MELQALADLLSQFVHDLRAPIRAVTGFSQALREEMSASVRTECQYYLNRLTENGRRLEGYSDCLARLARALDPPRSCESFQLRPVLTEILNSISATGAAIHIEKNQTDVCLANWDPRHFRLLVETLCRYAEYLNRGAEPGTAHMAGFAVRDRVELHFLLEHGASGASCKGAELTGPPGIELGIIRAILQHYPFTWLEVRAPWELRLCLGLPQPDLGNSAAPDHAVRGNSRQSQTSVPFRSAGAPSCLPHPPPIMLVDDDPAEWDLLQLVVEDTELKGALEWHRDSRQALAKLHDLANNGAASLPVVIFVDLRMPGLDGIAFVRKLREHSTLRYVPAVVLSSSNDPAEIRDAYAAGANAFVTKPTDFHCYAEYLHFAMAFWGRCNQVHR